MSHENFEQEYETIGGNEATTEKDGTTDLYLINDSYDSLVP